MKIYAENIGNRDFIMTKLLPNYYQSRNNLSLKADSLEATNKLEEIKADLLKTAESISNKLKQATGITMNRSYQDLSESR